MIVVHASLENNNGLQYMSILRTINSLRSSLLTMEQSIIQPTSSNIRAKLLSVGESFVGFDRALIEEAKRRKARDAQIAAEVSVDLQRLEEEIKAEIKARVDDIRNLQFFTQSAANTMLEDIQQHAVGKLNGIAGVFDKLTTRLVTMERGMQQFKGELPSKLLVDTAALVKETSESRAYLEQLRTVWDQRDNELHLRLAEVEQEISRKSDFSLNIMDHQVASLKADCSELTKPQGASQEEKFREFILSEFAAVKTGIQLEAETRQKADSEILEAIKSYSQALHKSIGESKQPR